MSEHTAENDALTKDDLRVLRRLAEAKRADLRRKPDTTADVLWAYDDLIGKLRRATLTTRVIPPASGDTTGGTR